VGVSGSASLIVQSALGQNIDVAYRRLGGTLLAIG
jgi:hypothetical protein